MTKQILSLIACFALILTIFILATLILTAVASATVLEPNKVYSGTITKTGELVKTQNPVNGVSVVGYICENQACTQNKKFAEFESKDNTIPVTYPTELMSKYGYKFYFYKQGYIPFEVNSDIHGTGITKSYNDYLYRLETGSAKIENLNIQSGKVNENIKVTANVLSPMIYVKDKYIPDELKNKGLFESSVKAELKITDKKTNEVVYTETKNLNMEYSTSKNIEFSYTPKKAGDYNIKISTRIDDNKIINPEIETQEATLKITTGENSDNGDNNHKTGKTPSGYRDLNKGDTLEDEQYYNQFKEIVLTSEEEPVKLSLWQKFIIWIKYVFRSLFWFLY